MEAQNQKRILKKDRVIDFLDEIASRYELIGPVQENTLSFRQVKSGSEITLDFTNSTLPPKNLFFPQTETLFQFTKSGEGFELQAAGDLERDRVILGIRACDVRSLQLLDLVFRGSYRDNYYLEKRERSILIGLACLNPPDTCFCTSFGLNPLLPDGVDILMSDLGDCYLVETLNERGNGLVGQFAKCFEEPIGDETAIRDTIAGKQTMARQLEVDNIAYKIGDYYNSDYWVDIARKCIGCAICTYLCPTCYCFDIVDESGDEMGERYRSWDSCMFADFALMANGENSLPTGYERVQQRFFHKFKYFYDKYGALACTGCGRCLKFCPVNIDIRQIIKDIVSG